MREKVVLEGQIAIQAALEAQNRPIYQLNIQKNKSRKFAYLISRAKQDNITISFLEQDAINSIARGQSHGGIVAIAGERHYLPLEQLAQSVTNPFLVMLDGIEDPYNFGQAIRAIYASGAHGLVVRERNWLSAGGIVARSSAGTSERIATAKVESPLDAIQHFKQEGLQIVCTAKNREAVDLYQAKFEQSLFLVIGGEKRGIAKSILSQADMLVKIPYARQFAYSLGATSATAIIAYEVARQRGVK